MKVQETMRGIMNSLQSERRFWIVVGLFIVSGMVTVQLNRYRVEPGPAGIPLMQDRLTGKAWLMMGREWRAIKRED